MGGADALLSRVAAASAAGVELVQVRERDLDGRSLAALVRACLQAVNRRRTRVVVNDRLDVALACGADGVHLRGDSIPPAAARAIVPAGFLVGCSVRTADEARVAARSADYLVFGTVFVSRSKPGHPASGLSDLRETVASSRVPVLAIGGVAVANAASIATTGAAGVAAIDLFAGPAVGEIGAVVQAVRDAFEG